MTADEMLAEIRRRQQVGKPKPVLRVGAVIIFKEDVDVEEAQELLDMMITDRLIEPTSANVFDSTTGNPVWIKAPIKLGEVE